MQGHVAGLVDASAAVVDVLAAGEFDAPAFQRAGVLQPARGGDDQPAGTGADVAGIAHADAGPGADQRDLAGVHAAKCRDVQRERRCGTACAGSAVRARDRLQLAGPDAGVDPQGVRQDGHVVGAGRIQSCAVDGDGAAPHQEAFERTGRVEPGRAGGERGAAGVDEAGAVDLDAGRIGDHDLGALAGHLHVAAQAARVGAVDFVEDDARRAPCQPGVARHLPGQARLRGRAAVVEYRPLGGDVELPVQVARDAGCARRLDVDQSGAARGGQHGGALGAGCVGVGGDLARGRRCGQRGQSGGHERRRAARRLAGAARRFLDGHAQAACGVEDDAVQMLVHGERSFSGRAECQ
ncbi:MAG: hypothetical protein QM777_19700 [Pseudorhodoferax sp.]